LQNLLGLFPLLFWNKSLLFCISPIKTYNNSNIDKVQILKENKQKSGIYMWTNLINSQRYIGSAVDLRIRFIKYFNTNHLLTNTCMYICRSLLKHGYSNFKLEILEYCEVSELLIREKYYWKLLKPEYNIAQDPTAPMTGRTHSEESKQIMSDIAKKIDHSGRFKTGHKHSEETKQKNLRYSSGNLESWSF
jgi:group I intron endonuclease